ncbi:hypothetical protein ABT336_20520 [Micromonospora sp. NPDC000207]|uniref:hypothetical protein n=1 Tax=Micromonospora sp. NPDC000207 TaxID=3154246 RepID=UPI003325F7F8
MVNDVRAGLPQWRGWVETDLDDLRAEVTGWATSTAMRDLVECFGQRWPSGDGDGDGDVDVVLAGLEEISARHWDFRGGRERAAAVPGEFSDGVADRVWAAADALGLRGRNLPDGSAYDHVLIHGGLLRGCLARAGHAADLLDGTVEAGEVCGLGSFRPTTEPELAMAAEAGLGQPADEFDAMDVALRATLPGALPDTDSPTTDGTDSPTTVGVGSPTTGADGVPASHRVREYRTAGGRRVRVLAAPSSDPGRRANTADTCTFWADAVGRPAPGQRVLLVTTEHYVPFQHADAIRVLGIPYGCAVETVGVDPTAAVHGLPGQPLTTGQYLQEIRSAIRSLRHLTGALRPAG